MQSALHLLVPAFESFGGLLTQRSASACSLLQNSLAAAVDKKYENSLIVTPFGKHSSEVALQLLGCSTRILGAIVRVLQF